MDVDHQKEEEFNKIKNIENLERGVIVTCQDLKMNNAVIAVDKDKNCS